MASWDGRIPLFRLRYPPRGSLHIVSLAEPLHLVSVTCYSIWTTVVPFVKLIYCWTYGMHLIQAVYFVIMPDHTAEGVIDLLLQIVALKSPLSTLRYGMQLKSCSPSCCPFGSEAAPDRR